MTYTRSREDTGYAWVVCAASFFSHLFCCGIYYSMGIFYIILQQPLSVDNSMIATVTSINGACAFMIAPMVGLLVARYGERTVAIVGSVVASIGYISSAFSTNIYHLQITFGVIGGCGQGIAYVPSLSILATYFKKRRGFAVGLALCGCGLGSILYPLLLEFLERQYGWRGALLLNGAIHTHTIVCGALYRPLPSPTSQVIKDITETKNIALSSSVSVEEGFCKSEQGSASISLGKDQPACHGTQGNICGGLFTRCHSIMRNPGYLLFSLCQTSIAMAVCMIYTHLGAFSITRGCSRNEASLLFLVMGITSTLGRPIAGALTQIPGFHPGRVFVVCMSLLGVLTAMVGFFKTMSWLLFYAGIFGILISPYNTYNVLIIGELIQPSLVSAALGFQLIFLVPGNLAGGPLAGIIFDKTGVYETSFQVAAGLLLIGGAVLLPAILKNGKKRRNTFISPKLIRLRRTNEKEGPK